MEKTKKREVSESQKKAISNYRKKNCKNVTVTFYPNDKELYEHYKKQPEKTQYIKKLIENDIENTVN